MRDRMLFRSMGLALMLLMMAAMAQAGDVYQNLSMPSGPNWNTSVTAWVPNGAPTAGNVYWVGTMPDGVTRTPGYTGSRIQCRTPNNPGTDPQTFAGDTLYINGTSATLMMKASNGQTVVVNDLRLIGGTPQVECGNNGVLHLAGNATVGVTNNGYLNFNVSDTSGQRHIVLDAKLTGGPHIRVQGGSSERNFKDHAVEFANNANTYSGRVFTNNAGKILVSQPNGLGNPTTITVNNRGQLQVADTVSVNWPNCDLYVAGGGYWWLNSPSQTFRSVRFPNVLGEGVQLAPGTYQSSTLFGTYPTLTTQTVAGGQVIVTTGLPSMHVPREADGTITTATFGNINPWLPAPTATVIIQNNGPVPLTFTPRFDQASPSNPGIVVQNNPTTATIYSLVSCVPSTATPLAAGASMTITLRATGTLADYDATPGADNTKAGTLRIYSNNYANFNIGIPLRGTTVPVEVSKFTTE